MKTSPRNTWLYGGILVRQVWPHDAGMVAVRNGPVTLVHQGDLLRLLVTGSGAEVVEVEHLAEPITA